MEFHTKRINRLQIATKINLNVPVESNPQSPVKQGFNIFKIQPSASEFKQDIGPRLDKNGELVKYSLVGKSDWYQRMQNQGKKAQFDDNVINKANRLLNEEKTIIRPTIDNKSQVKTKTLVMEKKMVRTREQFRTKNQLLDEIDAIKSRIDLNRVKEEEEQTDIPLPVRQVLKQQEVLFDNHHRNQTRWEEFIVRSSSKLERGQEFSQLIRSDSHRGRLEAAQTIEALRSDYERYGPRMWYMTLRKSSEQSENKEYLKLNDKKVLINDEPKGPVVLNRDLPEAFQFSDIGPQKRSVEYIRKPNQSTLSNFGLSNTQNSKSRITTSTYSLFQQHQPFQTLRQNKYLSERLESVKDSLMSKNMAAIPTDIDSLIIQGRSQLEAESEQVYTDKRGPQGQYKKYLDKREGEVEGVEIIAQDYKPTLKLTLPPVKKQKSKRLLRKNSGAKSTFSHVSAVNISNEIE